MRKSIFNLSIPLMIFAFLISASIFIRKINQKVQLTPQRPVFEKQLPNLININTATIEQLKLLPAISDGLANRIIQYRQENGPFQSVDELNKIKGIGPEIYNRISQYVTVGG